MDSVRLRQLLERLRGGTLEVDAALEELRALPFADLGYARVDHHRALRLGMPEVVFGLGKTPEQIAGVAEQLISAGQNVLITRLAEPAAAQVLGLLPALRYSPAARVATYEHAPIVARPGQPVAVVTAGTSDIPVAEEALESLRMFGIGATRIFDVGVAGIHRVLKDLDVIARAPAAIVVAGMEGALPSVVGGLVATPVIAVPTSVGYGAALDGFTALLGMLTGCASGVTVVNIDNGFGAAMAVARLMRLDRGVA
ncbi:MAG TPA: nickel pincer cofactor biosynthesis protein LarB [Polyangiaceae bacterium]|nr:nickel pincer cofactor biosynthesis protein LarB [Polyangiaceae bacterium]